MKTLLELFYRIIVIGFENHTDEVAVKYINKLVKLNNSWGLLELAVRLQTGKGVEKNTELALEYYQNVSNKGDKYSKYSDFVIGCFYLEGIDVDLCEKTASQWFEKAAHKGHPQAQYNWGLALYDGWAVQTDKEQGLIWLNKSAQSGCNEAKSIIARISKKT